MKNAETYARQAPKAEHLRILRHMLGMTDPYQRIPTEYRDYYCAARGNAELQDMEANGLVHCYRRDDSYDWYTTTDAGKAAARRSFLQVRLPRPKRVYRRFLSVRDACPDLTFREFLTNPDYAEIRRDA